MAPFVRQLGVVALAGLATLGLAAPPARAQFFPPNPGLRPLNTIYFNPAFTSHPFAGINTNYYISPYTTLQQSAYNTALRNAALGTTPPYLLGYNPYVPSINNGLYYGGGFNPYMMGGYGSTRSAGSGGYGASGNPGGAGGTGTNAYYYLRGAADITVANAQYQKIIQEARELRARTRVAALGTRRRVDGGEDEWNTRPASLATKGRREAAAPDETRDNPPLSAVLDGSALNALLREVRKQQNAGRRGPNVSLTEDVLDAVNLTPADARGNAGLLKDGGKLRWPAALEGPEFAGARKAVERLTAHAVREVTADRPVGRATLNDLRAALKGLNQALRGRVEEVSVTEYIVGQRYLKQLGQAVTALSDPRLPHYFNDRGARGKTVAELVRFMSANGLVFAPAVPGDEAAYAALYNALAAFDARLRPDPR